MRGGGGVPPFLITTAAVRTGDGLGLSIGHAKGRVLMRPSWDRVHGPREGSTRWSRYGVCSEFRQRSPTNGYSPGKHLGSPLRDPFARRREWIGMKSQTGVFCV